MSKKSQQSNTVLSTIDNFFAVHDYFLNSLLEVFIIDFFVNADEISISLIFDIVTRFNTIVQQNSALDNKHTAETNINIISLNFVEHDFYRYIQNLQIQSRRLYRIKRGFIDLISRSAQIKNRICCL